MAFSRVQGAFKFQADAAGSGTATYSTGMANFAVGNLVIVTLVHFAVPNTDVVSGVTINGTAATKATGVANATNNPNQVEIWYCVVASGGAHNVGVTMSGAGAGGGGNYYTLGVCEYSFSGSLSVAVGTPGDGTSTTASATTASSTAVGDLLATAFVFADAATLTIGAPSGYTTEFTEPDANNHEPGGGATRVAVASGANSVSWTLGVSGPWTAVSVTFSAASSTPSPGDFQRSPESRAPRAPVVAGWAPLPALAVAATSQGWGFSDPPRPRPQCVAPAAQVATAPLPKLILPGYGMDAAPAPAPRRAPFVDGWNPIPAVAAAAWGFSSGQQSTPLPPVLGDWTPLPGLAAATQSAVAVDCQAPLPRKTARVIPDGWEPIPLLAAVALPALVEPQPTVSARQARAVGSDWEPLAGLGVESVDCQAPDPRRLTRVLPDAWEPLGQLVATAATVLVESQAPANRPVSRASAGDNWEPLAAIQAAAPSSFGYECATPINPRVRGPRPDAWEPLPAFIPPPVVPSGFECSTFLPRKMRAPIVDAWQPVGSVTVAPALVPNVDTAAPEPRRARSPQLDGWTPLDALAAPAVDFSSPTVGAARRAVVEGWEPVASLGQPPLPLLVECQPATLGVRRAPPVDGWEPLPGLPFVLPGFSAQPEPAARRRAFIAEWIPLASVAVPLPPSGLFSPQPFSKPPRTMVPDWEPLPALIPPPPVLPWADFASPLPRAVLSAKIADEGSGWLTVLVIGAPSFVSAGHGRTAVARPRERIVVGPRRRP